MSLSRISDSPGHFLQSPVSDAPPGRGRGGQAPVQDPQLPSWLFGLEDEGDEEEEEKTSTAAAEVNVKLGSYRRYDDREKESGVFNVCRVWKA